MPNFDFSFRFLEKLWTYLTLLGGGILGHQETCDVKGGFNFLEKVLFWPHIRISHDESGQNSKFQLFIQFLWEVMTIWLFCGYFGSPGDLVMGPNFENFTILTPAWNSPLRDKFQLFIPFLWEVINIWPFLVYFESPGHPVTSKGGFKFRKIYDFDSIIEFPTTNVV